MPHWYLDGKRLEDNDLRLLEATKAVRAQRKAAGTHGRGAKDEARMKLGAVPGVTDILKFVGSSEGLLNWCMNIGIDAAINVNAGAQDPFSTNDDWTFAAKNLGRAMRALAAERGTELHKAIDLAISMGGPQPSDDHLAQVACKNVLDLLDKMELLGKGKPEHGFSINPKTAEYITDVDAGFVHGFGGTIDYLVESPERVIMDWKTIKDKRNPTLVELAQMAAYGKAKFGFGRSFAAYNVYILQETCEIVDVKAWSPDQLDMGWNLFALALEVFHTFVSFEGLN